MQIHTTFRKIAKCSLDHALKELWRKGYDTKDFLKGLSDVTIHSKTDDLIERTMKLGPLVIKEKIYKDEKEGKVIFSNIQGSSFVGDIFNQAILNEKGEVEVIFTSAAHDHDGNPVPPPQMYQAALEGTVAVIQSTYHPK